MNRFNISTELYRTFHLSTNTDGASDGIETMRDHNLHCFQYHEWTERLP